MKLSTDLFDQNLKFARSTLPEAGKGLFTTLYIPKGSFITEYKGKLLAGMRHNTKMTKTFTSFIYQKTV